SGACPVAAPTVKRVPGGATSASLAPVVQTTPPTSTAAVPNPVYLLSTAHQAATVYTVWRVYRAASGSYAVASVAASGATGGYSLPTAAPQGGGGPGLDTGDGRITAASGAADTIVGAHTTGCNVGGGAVETCIDVFRVHVGQTPTGTLTA